VNVVELRSRLFRRGRGSRPWERRSERGASAVEYGLLVAGIAGVIIAAVFLLGGGSNGMFQDSCHKIIEDTSVGTCD